MIFCAVVPRLFFEFVFYYLRIALIYGTKDLISGTNAKYGGWIGMFLYLYALGQTPVCFRKKAEKFCWDPYPQ